jgi:two-component system OmpR family response regulator
MAGRLLVVNDEPETSRALQGALALEGLDVILARDETEALEVVQDTEPDAVIVDLAEPGARGAALCRRLRVASPQLPVLMVGAADTVVERTGGLAVGADDYLAKPFSFAELVARLRALVRRAPVERPTILSIGDLRLDPAAKRAWRGETELSLSSKEFALLELFMRRPGVTLSRDQLLQGAWDMAFHHRSNVVDVYLRYLREKIDRPFGRHSLETVRGVGYRLREDAG